jgi:lipoic acid synthetase
MGLRHVVVTMVARDDLPDGGASAMAHTVRAIRAIAHGCRVEVLPSDLAGPDLVVDRASVDTLLASGPDIISHNLETIRRLTPVVRSHSDYDRSLGFLRTVKELSSLAVTKSSLMLGLGEEEEEVVETMDDLRAIDVNILNLGQYLQPGRTQLSVKRFWKPEEFDRLKRIALERGFLRCDSGPFVRSSYHAEEQTVLTSCPN